MGKGRKHIIRAKRNRAGLLAAFLSLVFYAAVYTAAVCFAHVNTRVVTKTMSGLQAGENVKMGTIIDPEGRQKKLGAIVGERMVVFSVNTTPLMINDRGKANLYIESPPENGNCFTVTTIRDDTGEEIYRSGYLDPEQYTDEAALDVELDKGEHTCTVDFDTYHIRDSSYIGRAAAQTTLYVLK